MLGTATYAVIEAPGRGWTSPSSLALGGVALAALAALVPVELRRAEPLVELRLFRSVPFAAATATAVAAFVALAAFLFVNTLYLQQVRHLSPVDAGLRTLPMAVLAAAMAPLSGRLVAARGARLPLVLAGTATAAGALLLVRLSPQTPQVRLLVAYGLVGLGFGLVNAPITHTATSGMPREQAGVAAAIASTSRQVGSCLGVAVGGSLVAGTSGAAFAAASHPVWLVVVGCGAVIVVLGVLGTGPAALATAVRARERVVRQDGPHELADA